MPQPQTPTGIDRRTPAHVSDFEAADALLRGPVSNLSPLGRRLRTRAADRLSQRMETDLRGGVAPFSTEAAALAVLKATARDLRQAAAALYEAAARLRSAQGLGLAANKAFMAAREAEAAADGIDPS
jgi:hypothetical protein